MILGSSKKVTILLFDSVHALTCIQSSVEQKIKEASNETRDMLWVF